jgi:hypothetical protein
MENQKFAFSVAGLIPIYFEFHNRFLPDSQSGHPSRHKLPGGVSENSLFTEKSSNEYANSLDYYGTRRTADVRPWAAQSKTG